MHLGKSSATIVYKMFFEYQMQKELLSDTK